MKLIKVFAVFVLVTMALTSCLKEEPIKASAVPPPNFNQIPTGPGGISQSYSWTSIADFPGIARDEAVAFTLKGQGYVGLGVKFPDYQNDFYRYDPGSNTWTKLADFPGGGRRGAIQFVINDTAYVGLGYGPGGGGSGFEEKEDLWKYDVTNDTWIQISNLPASRSESCAAFTLGNTAYVVSERGEVYQYNAVADTFIAKKELSEFNIDNRASAVSFRLGSTIYYGTGFDENGGGLGGSRLRDFYQYTSSTDSWVEMDSLPGAARTSAVSFVINGLGFVGTGSDFFSNYEDFYYYSAGARQWVRVQDFPGGPGAGLSAFVINNVAYVGLGYLDSGGLLGAESNKFYKISL